MSQALHNLASDEAELKRRADEARVRSILEAKDPQEREQLRAKERRQKELLEQEKTNRFASWFLLALLATALFAAAQWAFSGS